MRNLYLVFIFALALSFFYILNDGAWAQCENDSGAAYGLCTAYCAMGCTGTSTDSEGCVKVADKYMEFTGNSVSCGPSSCRTDRDCATDEHCCTNGNCIPNTQDCLIK